MPKKSVSTNLSIICKIKNKMCTNSTDSCKCFNKVIYNDICHAIKSYSNKNSCVMMTAGKIGHILEIHEIESSHEIACSFFKRVHNFFEEPIPSSKIGVYRFSDLSSGYRYQEFSAKC